CASLVRSFPRQQREASGGPGGGNEPPGRGTDVAKSWHGCLLVVAGVVQVLGCNRLCELRRVAGRPRRCLREGCGTPGPMTPAQLSQYAASPIRYGQPQAQPPGAYATRLVVRRIAKAAS